MKHQTSGTVKLFEENFMRKPQARCLLPTSIPLKVKKERNGRGWGENLATSLSLS